VFGVLNWSTVAFENNITLYSNNVTCTVTITAECRSDKQPPTYIINQSQSFDRPSPNLNHDLSNPGNNLAHENRY